MRPKWQITPQVHQAALLLSQRATWEFTAEQIGVTTNTIGNWLQHPAMRALVGQYEQQIIDKLAEDLGEGMREMVTLWREMVRGEVKANDRRLDRIGPIVTKYFVESLSFTEDSGTKGASPALAVQFNVGTSQSGDA